MSLTLSLTDALTDSVNATPDAPAIIVGADVVSFAELHRRVRASLVALDELVGEGQRVAIIGPNHRIWIESYYSVPGSGRLLVFLNHRLSAGELVALLARSGASAVIGEPSQLARLRDAGVVLPMEDWEKWERRVSAVVDLPELPIVDPMQSAWLLFTSGTTAAPKGALLSHSSVLSAVAASTAARPVEPDDVYIFPFPLCHVAGYNVVHRHIHGRPVVLIDQFDASSFCDAVEANRATSTSLAATMLASIVDELESNPSRLEQLRSLRTVAYGASPMPSSLLRRTHDLLGVEFAQGYGMTELSGNAVFLDAAHHRRGFTGEPELLRAAGVAAPGVELRLVSDDGQEVPEGGLGEITVRSDQVMKGYLDDPDATATALGNGWLHTGDIGKIIDGVLYVVDRKKDIIITGGENVSSLEVEDVISHFPNISRVAVVGVPDPIWGENVCAVVVVKAGEVLNPSDLVAHVRASLGGFKVPRHIVEMHELPVNGSGKVLKNELRDQLLNNPSLLGNRL